MSTNDHDDGECCDRRAKEADEADHDHGHCGCDHASLWLAIIADTGATLLVVANALRLLRD